MDFVSYAAIIIDSGPNTSKLPFHRQSEITCKIHQNIIDSYYHGIFPPSFCV